MKVGKMYAAVLCFVVAGALGALFLAHGPTMSPGHQGAAALTAKQTIGLPPYYVSQPQTASTPAMTPNSPRTAGLPPYMPRHQIVSSPHPMTQTIGLPPYYKPAPQTASTTNPTTSIARTNGLPVYAGGR